MKAISNHNLKSSLLCADKVCNEVTGGNLRAHLIHSCSKNILEIKAEFRQVSSVHISHSGAISHHMVQQGVHKLPDLHATPACDFLYAHCPCVFNYLTGRAIKPGETWGGKMKKK
jgi:hypothetical protein